MKKSFIYIAFALIVLPFTFAHAASGVVAVAKTAKQATKPKSTLLSPTTPIVPLSIRKQNAITSLTATQTQFGLFAARTQTTIDLLTAKNVDTTTAQADLDTATTALDLAKTNLTLFALIAVNDTIPEKSNSELTTTLSKIETNLTDARTNIIKSLTDLKASVALAIGTDTQ